MTILCPHCQQPMPKMRCGVALTNRQAKIFDIVKSAGFGISAAVIAERLGISPWTVKTTVQHMNQRLRTASMRVSSKKLGYRILHLERRVVHLDSFP